MRLEIHAIGRLKAGPERELADRYLERLAKTGPAIGLEFGGVSEHAESRARSVALRKKEEAEMLSSRISPSSVVFVLDEKGRSLDSAAFAGRVAKLRDGGGGGLALVIGGPDGLDDAMLRSANMALSFGAMTWPHQIVRVLLAEQLYRAVTILSGHPYHRV